jgi:GNAT superfamily N-acetyltransferase
MTGPKRFPEVAAGEFPSPPRTVEDADGREIHLRASDGSDADREALRAMYEAFDPADRAQGIPPSRPSKLADWLDRILTADCCNVFAWDGDEVVGHATLVPENGPESPYELAIFVLQSHQGAGIGTALMESILGHGTDVGISEVWLTVERWNRSAVGLYEKIGFETTDAESFELEMAIRLDDDQTERTG